MISINNQVLTQNHFPDGTLNLKTPEIDSSSDIAISWNYENDADWSRRCG